MSRFDAKRKVAPAREIKPRPTSQQMCDAWAVIDAYRLHFYQLLWCRETPLTQPGGAKHGRPFALKNDEEHTHCINVLCQPWSGRREEFDFTIRPDMTDEQVIRNCERILEAIQQGKQKIHSMACCALAEMSNCVCAYSFTCELHGDRHVGTHD